MIGKSGKKVIKFHVISYFYKDYLISIFCLSIFLWCNQAKATQPICIQFCQKMACSLYMITW